MFRARILKKAVTSRQACAPIGDEPRYSIPEHVHFTVIDETAILLDGQSGKYLHLNEVATRILQLIDNRCQHTEIVERLAAEFEVEREVVTADLGRFLHDLDERGLVR